jgi:hypothetical protein
MWAYAISPYGLALSEETFWGLTHAEYKVLREQHEEHQDFLAMQTAQIQAQIYNSWRPAGAKPLNPKDLVPMRKNKPQKAMTQAEYIRSIDTQSPQEKMSRISAMLTIAAIANGGQGPPN